MKRLTIALSILALASQVLAFDPSRGARIAVVDSSMRYGGPDAAIAATIERRLCDELRSRGFEVTETEASLDRLAPNDPANADYYIELAGSGGSSEPLADASVGAGNIAVDFGVIVSHVATRMLLYDGRTLEPLRTFHLEKHSTSLLPIGIGAWSPHFGISVAAPVRWMQERTVMRGIAHDAAEAVAAHLRQVE